jgi:hypothetical protein
LPCHHQADHRRDRDRGEARDRVAADHQFECIEGARERRTERAGDSPGGSAPDQHPQIAAAQAKSLPDEGGDAAGELGIAGFEADRCADPARPHRLRRDDQAAAQRHAPAMQRIGLDRVDFARRPIPRDHDTRQSQDEPAEGRHEDRDPRVESRLRRQPLPRTEPEQNDVQQIDERRHRRHHQSAERADQDREQHQAGFAGSHERAHPARYIEGKKTDRGNEPARVATGPGMRELGRLRHRVGRQRSNLWSDISHFRFPTSQAPRREDSGRSRAGGRWRRWGN